FCMPHKYEVEGTVSSTMQLNDGGSVINNFRLTFKAGIIVELKAEQGEEALKQLVDMDERSHRLGEVTLVQHMSPISNAGIIFYNTLFDENASCDIALGKAYPTNLEGGSSMDKEGLAKHSANDSVTHVDFMIGSAELDIDGVRE